MADQELSTRTIVGMEIHVQLRTNTKLFCACPVVFDAPPNSCTCEVCLGHPGALPVINRRAVEFAILTGLALQCEIASHTKWDRKSYYYPDLPKNYQISQYDLPIAQRGHFDIEVAGRTRRIRIRRAHLEEDAGKNIHDAGEGTLVDLNRAGTPLLEIVTEPDIASPEEAFVFCTELQRLVRHLGVSEASMQKGQMRFEPNVNVAITADGREFRTPIAEVKNINSFRFVRQAIEFEQQRQTAQWQADHGYVIGQRPNENRGWNAQRGVTEFQRGKEAAHDYRYFPDPDLLPIEVSAAMLDGLRAKLPEPPLVRRTRLVREYGLSPDDAELIVDDRPAADFFEQVLAAGAPPELAAKQFVNIWMKLAGDRAPALVDSSRADPARAAPSREGLPLTRRPSGSPHSGAASAASRRVKGKGAVAPNGDQARCVNRDREGADLNAGPAASPFAKGGPSRVDAGFTLDPARIAELARITADGVISRTAAAQVAQAMLDDPQSPRTIAERLGLLQVRDTGATQAWVDQAFAENAQAVQDALANPKKAKAAAGFLRGQVMKISGGKADPRITGELIDRQLAALRTPQ